MRVETMKLISKIELIPNLYELVCEGEMVSEIVMSGQFVDIKVPREDLVLRRPISICSVDKAKKQMTLIIRASGNGTQSICETKIGETLDVLGPCGKGFPIDFLKQGQHVLLIGGGIGIPPLYELAKQLSLNGLKLTFVFGFQSKNQIFYQKEFEALGEVLFSTDDGSHGVKGTVETILNSDHFNEETDAIYACGPKGLNRMINQRYRNHPHAYISLEERMACGIGACAACVCDKDDQSGTNLKVCEDGPVFKCGEVIV
jgi:dihydroorotate dehydrogenase electron transfer subunit